jgi:hypothetical protein
VRFALPPVLGRFVLEIDEDMMEAVVDVPEAKTTADDAIVLLEIVVDIRFDVALVGARLSTPLGKIRTQVKAAMPLLYDQRVEAVISVHGTLGRKSSV